MASHGPPVNIYKGTGHAVPQTVSPVLSPGLCFMKNQDP